MFSNSTVARAVLRARADLGARHDSMGCRETALGATHTDTLGSAEDLAIFLGKQGKYEEARQLKSKYNV